MRSLALASLAFLSSCSGSSNPISPAPDLAVPPPDLSVPPPDLTVPPPDLSKPDPVDMTVALQCTKPADCGGNPCCMKIDLFTQMLKGLSCAPQKTDCVPTLGAELQTRTCNTNADCTAGPVTTDLNLCCDGMQGGQSLKFCASKTLEMLAQGRIKCP